MNKLVKNDQVVVIAGKDKGRIGNVTQVLTNGKLVIQGLNVAKKHQKGNPQAGIPGGIIDKEMPVDASNVMLVNPATNNGGRVGIKVLENGDKVRFFKSNGESVS